MRMGSGSRLVAGSEDIEKGEVGRVVGIKVDKGQLRVAFLKGEGCSLL